MHNYNLYVIVLAMVVGGFCVKNFKKVNVYLSRAELDEHFNDTQNLCTNADEDFVVMNYFIV